jgi:hypothetical protein
MVPAKNDDLKSHSTTTQDEDDEEHTEKDDEHLDDVRQRTSVDARPEIGIALAGGRRS